MMDIEKIVRDEPMAIVPLYADTYGNSTKIITKKSDAIFIYRSIRTVLRVFAQFFTLDLNSVRKIYGEIIGSSNIVPIPFNLENIFVPVKTRKPISRNDGTLSYINLRFVERIEENGDGVYVVLDGNIRLKSLQHEKTIRKHIRDGKLIKKIYENRQKTLVMENKGDFFTEFSKPATKGDIAILRDELLAIKSKLDK